MYIFFFDFRDRLARYHFKETFMHIILKEKLHYGKYIQFSHTLFFQGHKPFFREFLWVVCPTIKITIVVLEGCVCFDLCARTSHSCVLTCL